MTLGQNGSREYTVRNDSGPRGRRRVEKEFLGEGVDERAERGLTGAVAAVAGEGVESEDGRGENNMPREGE